MNFKCLILIITIFQSISGGIIILYLELAFSYLINGTFLDNNTINNTTTNISNLSNNTDPFSDNNMQPYDITNPLNDTRCKPECYLNCQIHFPVLIEQKYCISNVCHCIIITNNTTIYTNNTLLCIF